MKGMWFEEDEEGKLGGRARGRQGEGSGWGDLARKGREWSAQGSHTLYFRKTAPIAASKNTIWQFPMQTQ